MVWTDLFCRGTDSDLMYLSGMIMKGNLYSKMSWMTPVGAKIEEMEKVKNSSSR